MTTLYPYTPKKSYDLIDSFKHQYDVLLTDFVLKRPERTLNGIPIYFDVDHKAIINCENKKLYSDSATYLSKVLHLCSSNKHKPYILNCNPTSKRLCSNIEDPEFKNCEKAIYYIIDNAEERKLCFERINKIHWIPKIIEFANSNSSCTRIIDDNSDICLLYKANSKSQLFYKIIFSPNHVGKPNEIYALKTAYPVTDYAQIRQYRQIFKK